MTQIRLSPKALGILFHISKHGATGGAKTLSEAFGEGVKYIYSGLTELRANGLVDLITGKTDKKTFWSRVEITEKGKSYLKHYHRVPKRHTEPSAKRADSLSQNSYLANYPNSIEAYSVNQGDALSASHKETEEFIEGVDMWLDPDDLAAEMEKDRKRKAEERTEAKKKKHTDRQKIRASRPVEKWTPTDVVNYFAELVKTVWHISEVTTNQRPAFIHAMKNFRADFDTTGDIEKEILDRWIDSQKHDTDKRSPDALFFGFIKYAPSMLEEAKRALAPEDLDRVESVKEKRRAQLGVE